jgi:hypothetical protein
MYPTVLHRFSFLSLESSNPSAFQSMRKSSGLVIQYFLFALFLVLFLSPLSFLVTEIHYRFDLRE